MRVKLGLILLLVAIATTSSAQTTSKELTPAQCATFKADIIADSSLNVARTGRQDQIIANAYNLPASPQYWVWKSTLSRSNILLDPSVDGTTFDITGLTVRTTQEVLAFQAMFDPLTALTNPMVKKVRDNFGVLQNGAAPQPANITHMLASARRLATRLERLFVNTTYLACTGGTGANGPCIMTFEGEATTQHVACALNLP